MAAPNTFFPRKTNIGIPLTSEFLGGESDTVREIPPEFRAALDLTVIEIPMPWDVLPVPLSDTVLASKAEMKVTSERMRRTTYKPPGQKTLVEHYTDKYKQFGIRTRVFKTEGDAVLTPNVTRDVNTKNLGNLHFIEDQEDTLTLFTEELWKVSIPDPIPKEFAVLLPTTEHSYVLPEVVIPPVLGIGELEHTSQQVNVFVGRETSVYRDTGSLPRSLVEYRLTPEQQVMTIVGTLDIGLQTLVPFDTMLLGEVQNLGNNTSLKKVGTVPVVFDKTLSSINILNLIPPEFRGLIPDFEKAVTLSGTVVDPPIVTGTEISKSEEQMTVFTKRVTTKSLGGPGLPITYSNQELGGEQFGGEVISVELTLDSFPLTISQGEDIIEAATKTLSPSLYLRTLKKRYPATEWPKLYGTEVDPRTGVVVAVTRQVVAAPATGGVGVDGYVDIKPIDKWRSLRIASKLDPSTLPAVRTWETTVEHSFPNTLLGITWVWASASAPFAYDFDSALVLDMLQGYSGPCRALVTESFSNGPPVTSVSTTQFFPQGHMIGFAWAFAADPSDECGTCIGHARASARTWPVPPSLHGALTIGGGVTLVGGTFTNVLPATTPVGLPASGTLITKSVEVEPWRFNIFYRKMVQIYVP